MTPAEAAWVRANAWRNCHRRTVRETPTFYNRCWCERSQCQYCRMNEHRKCSHELHTPVEMPATYLTDRGGYVKAQVWEAGHRHVWTCACKKAGHDTGPAQMTLF